MRAFSAFQFIMDHRVSQRHSARFARGTLRPGDDGRGVAKPICARYPRVIRVSMAENDLKLVVQCLGGIEKRGNLPDVSDKFDDVYNVEQV